MSDWLAKARKLNLNVFPEQNVKPRWVASNGRDNYMWDGNDWIKQLSAEEKLKKTLKEEGIQIING